MFKMWQLLKLVSIHNSGGAEAKRQGAYQEEKELGKFSFTVLSGRAHPAPLTGTDIHKPGKDFVNVLSHLKQTCFITNYSSQGKSDTLFTCKLVIIMLKTTKYISVCYCN